MVMNSKQVLSSPLEEGDIITLGGLSGYEMGEKFNCRRSRGNQTDLSDYVFEVVQLEDKWAAAV